MTDHETILLYFFNHIVNHNGLVDKRKNCFRAGYDSNPLYKSSLSILKDRGARGWSLNDIKLLLLEARELKIRTSKLSDIIPIRRLGSGDNVELMQPTEKYTHPKLRIVTPPVYDEDGTLLQHTLIQRRKSFTFNDLVEYYQENLHPSIQRTELAKILRYTLNLGTELDALLYGIDFWLDDLNNEGARSPNDPWQLQNVYAKRALEEIGRFNVHTI